MKLLRRSFLWMLAICLACPAVLPAYAEGNVLQNQAVNGGVINQNIIFVDVKGHWANDAIYDMAGKGIISGYEDDSFKPENSITREEFAKLIAVTFSVDLTTKGTPSFSDVLKDRWSYAYVESVKEYLTGYYPPKGLAFFSPDTKATREDVAVALVKILGYSTDDLQDPNILSKRFRDVNDISFGLRDYVALAAENQLISGYEDRTFRPEYPITRAEVATLLYKVIKSSAQDQSNGPSLEVSMPETTATGTFYISGTTAKGAKVTINGRPAEVIDGKFREGIALDEEGTYNVTISAKVSNGPASTVYKKITYEATGPKITLHNVPETSAKKSITVNGKVTDPTDSQPDVFLNGEKLYVSFNGDFTTTVQLELGENTLTFKAVNDANRITEVEKTVTFQSDGPVLKVDSIPETTSSMKLKLRGSVTDANDSSPSLYVNDERLYPSLNGSFSWDITLKVGENVLTFIAKSSTGKTTTVVKRVTFQTGGPELLLDEKPSSVQSNSYTVSGTVKDKNDESPVVHINDERVYLGINGNFSLKVSLTLGENVLKIRAKNSTGKETIMTKTIVFDAPAPKITMDYLPERTRISQLTVSGNITDPNDEQPSVYLNDEKLYSSWNSKFTQSVTLHKGANTFVITGMNKYGKSTTVTKTVYQE